MQNLSKNLTLAAIILGLGASGAWAEPTSSPASSLGGRWDATVTINGTAIPFRLDISGDGASLTGTLYNGDEKETTTSTKLDNGTIVLNYETYLTSIQATAKDGQLEGAVQGRFEQDRYITSYPFRAKRYAPAAVSASNAPSVGGQWIVPYDSPKGEKAWRLIVKQTGPEVSAAILRVDGDTGALTGTWQNGKFVLSHFDGARAMLMEITPAQDGTLEIQQSGPFTPKNKLIAYRPEQAQAKGLPAPSDYTTHTTMKDPNEVFAYSFPDVNGKVLSNEDPKFKGKVVLAIVTGTWCPNCHDEAQYLVQLYAKYHSQGWKSSLSISKSLSNRKTWVACTHSSSSTTCRTTI